MTWREVSRKSHSGSVDGGHVTSSVSDVELKEERAAMLRVVGVEGGEGVTGTACDVTSWAVGEGRAGGGEKRCDEAVDVTWASKESYWCLTPSQLVRLSQGSLASKVNELS